MIEFRNLHTQQYVQIFGHDGSIRVLIDSGHRQNCRKIPHLKRELENVVVATECCSSSVLVDVFEDDNQTNNQSDYDET